MKLIGLDLDGVIADTDKTIREYIFKLFGKKLEREHIFDAYYEKCLDLSIRDLSYLWEKFYDENAWEKIDVIQESKYTLNKLSDKFNYVIVTSRPEYLYNSTKKWLAKHDIKYLNLVVTSKEKKSEIIKKNNWNLSYFIEDRYDFAQDISGINVPVLLYDYPWNNEGKEVKNIKRVYSWLEIERIIKN
jgi:uncharacterized HAD superfamily protein